MLNLGKKQGDQYSRAFKFVYHSMRHFFASQTHPMKWNKFTYEALQDMRYLECVLQGNDIWLLVIKMPLSVLFSYLRDPSVERGRIISGPPYTLPIFGNQKEGVTIYPGQTVIIPVRAIHMYVLLQIDLSLSTARGSCCMILFVFRDENYFPNPEAFNPDRLTEDERKRRHKAHFLPFGEGLRMYMRLRFANTQIEAAAMTVVRDFKITLSPNHKPFVFDNTVVDVAGERRPASELSTAIINHHIDGHWTAHTFIVAVTLTWCFNRFYTMIELKNKNVENR